MELLVLARRMGVMIIHCCCHPLLRAGLFAVSFYLVVAIGFLLEWQAFPCWLPRRDVSLAIVHVTQSLGMLLIEWLSADMPTD